MRFIERIPAEELVEGRRASRFNGFAWVHRDGDLFYFVLIPFNILIRWFMYGIEYARYAKPSKVENQRLELQHLQDQIRELRVNVLRLHELVLWYVSGTIPPSDTKDMPRGNDANRDDNTLKDE